MTSEEKPPRDDSDGGLRWAAPYLSFGLSLALSVALGVGAGSWLDRRFGTSPVFLLVGAALGMTAAGIEIYKTASGRVK